MSTRNAPRFASGLGLGLAFLATSVRAQVPPPPPPEPPPSAPGTRGPIATPPPRMDVQNLAQQMIDQLRRLGDDAATDLARVQGGPDLANQAQELAIAVEEFSRRPATNDPVAGRRAYSNLHSSWQFLRGQLSQPGFSTAILTRDVAAVEAVDAKIAQSLAMNPLPTSYYASGVAPTGMDQVRRLARSLVDRAEGLAQAVQADMGADPNAAPFVADANALARESDAWHDGLNAGNSIELAARSLGPVDAIADRMESYVTSRPISPRVGAAWTAYATAEGLIHQSLGMKLPAPAGAIDPFAPAPPASVPGVIAQSPGVNVTTSGVDINVPFVRMKINTPIPAPGVAPAPAASPVDTTVLSLSNAVVGQTNEFINVFGPTAGVVPSGGLILNDARALLAAATNFRQDVARGLDSNSLAFEFRDVDAIWVRLVRRVNRVARGRTGPNIQQVQRIQESCEQLHQALGMPGYPPTLQPF